MDQPNGTENHCQIGWRYHRLSVPLALHLFVSSDSVFAAVTLPKHYHHALSVQSSKSLLSGIRYGTLLPAIMPRQQFRAIICSLCILSLPDLLYMYHVQSPDKSLCASHANLSAVQSKKIHSSLISYPIMLK